MLDDWINIFNNESYLGTIPESIFKLNFKYDPLQEKE